MIKVYFVRHAEPEHGWGDDRTRPLTEEGKLESKKVMEFFSNKVIHEIYCSPYKRSMDTIADTAEFFKKEILTDERLRERKPGPGGNVKEEMLKRWTDFNYYEEEGESIGMVQQRNIAALKDILSRCQTQNEYPDISIIIGTHGTALGSILNYFDPHFNFDSFLRILDWMPYVVELDFVGDTCVGKTEHLHVEKVPNVVTEVKFYNEVEDDKLKFAVIISRTQGKWVFCKHRDRDTYEAAGGHREPGEAILVTAMRELQEETGAIDFELKPVCVYSVSNKRVTGEQIGEESFGMLCYAEIHTFEKELHSEIESIWITKHLPDNWTYPGIQPELIKRVKQLGYL